MFTPPDGYVLLDDFDEKPLPRDCKIMVKGYNNWMDVCDWTGLTVRQVLMKRAHVIQAAAIKGKIKPRFENPRPFPHGY